MDQQAELIGGWLALDFCNTLDGPARTSARDELGNTNDWHHWCASQGLAEAAERDRGLPSDTELSEIRGVRESLYRLFMAALTRTVPDTGDILSLARIYAQVPAARKLKVTQTPPYQLIWSKDIPFTQRAIAAIAQSAVDLLTSDAILRLRQCEGACTSLFIDTTKNHSRRWCSMSRCGNLHKVEAYRRRMKVHNR